MTNEHVIEVSNLKKWFPLRRGLMRHLFGRTEPEHIHAVDGVSFSIRAGEVLGLVGESGSGKTTVGMTTLRLWDPTEGSISFLGTDITRLSPRDLKPFRRQAQIVFQNPYESLNARFTVHDSVVEPLLLHSFRDRAVRMSRVIQALERAELYPARYFLHRYPHELSGGQRQRLAIARAIVLEPKFLVADEPVSMLDVSIRAGVLNLLKRLSCELGTAMLYVSHDLATVRYICQNMATMYAGQIVELGNTDEIIAQPLHPYTRLLIRAVPQIDVGTRRQRVLLEGEVPNLVSPPAGCRFHPRCPEAMDICRSEPPVLQEAGSGHQVRCHLYGARHP